MTYVFDNNKNSDYSSSKSRRKYKEKRGQNRVEEEREENRKNRKAEVKKGERKVGERKGEKERGEKERGERGRKKGGKGEKERGGKERGEKERGGERREERIDSFSKNAKQADIAADLLIYGRTVHSGTNLRVPLQDSSTSHMRIRSESSEKLKQAHVLIDEVSMLSCNALVFKFTDAIYNTTSYIDLEEAFDSHITQLDPDLSAVHQMYFSFEEKYLVEIYNPVYISIKISTYWAYSYKCLALIFTRCYSDLGANRCISHEVKHSGDKQGQTKELSRLQRPQCVSGAYYLIDPERMKVKVDLDGKSECDITTLIWDKKIIKESK
uniref:Uncharacterized protein n=1 Tax=Octopus bimaculoides TaxID=37653 RepID=A0A0L8HVT7_OCTBM